MRLIQGSRKIRDTILGVPIIRLIVLWGFLRFALFMETTIQDVSVLLSPLTPSSSNS